MAFKMKGSPFQRNYGIGASPVQHKGLRPHGHPHSKPVKPDDDNEPNPLIPRPDKPDKPEKEETPKALQKRMVRRKLAPDGQRKKLSDKNENRRNKLINKRTELKEEGKTKKDSGQLRRTQNKINKIDGSKVRHRKGFLGLGKYKKVRVD